MKTKFFFLVFGVFAGLIIIFAAKYLSSNYYTYQGSLIDPPVQAVDFTLLDQNSQPFRLSEQKGKINLIFFGYTNCQDVCPVTLAQFKKIKDDLKQDSQNVQFIFITVDPDRDNPSRIKSYLANFDPTFIGLTEDTASLEQVWKDYGVYQSIQATSGTDDIVVDHTTRIFLVDSQGNWRLTYPFSVETSNIVNDIHHLIDEG